MSDWTEHHTHVRPSAECHLCNRAEAESGLLPRMAAGRTGAVPDERTDQGTSTPTSNVDKAARTLQVRFRAFSLRIQVDEREHFFHPINRSNWVNEFANWLHEEEASND